MNKYIFKKYNPKYKQLFYKEKSRLKKALGSKIKIEHIGSTAVPNLGGKGIIDIIVSTPKNQITKIKNKIIKIGYNWKKESGDKNRIYFEKYSTNKNKIRMFNLHLTSNNSLDLKNSITLRNYLVNNPKKAKEYEQIKKQAIRICKGNRELYKKYKNKFLEETIKKAVKKLK